MRYLKLYEDFNTDKLKIKDLLEDIVALDYILSDEGIISTVIKKLEKDTAVKVAPKKAPKRSSKPMSLSKSSKKKAVAIKKSAKKKVSAR